MKKLLALTSIACLLALSIVTALNAAGAKPLTLVWDWSPTNPPAEYVLLAHSTDLAANPNPETWAVIQTLPGFTVSPAPPAGSRLNLTFCDATGTNWFAVYYTGATPSFVTNQIVPTKSYTLSITPTSADFFAVRSSNVWSGVGPFSNVAGVNGPPSAAVLHLQ